MSPSMQSMVAEYVRNHAPDEACSFYLEKTHYFQPGGMDDRGLLSQANDAWDATGGQLYRCCCGAARIGPGNPLPGKRTPEVGG